MNATGEVKVKKESTTPEEKTNPSPYFRKVVLHYAGREISMVICTAAIPTTKKQN